MLSPFYLSWHFSFLSFISIHVRHLGNHNLGQLSPSFRGTSSRPSNFRPARSAIPPPDGGKQMERGPPQVPDGGILSQKMILISFPNQWRGRMMIWVCHDTTTQPLDELLLGTPNHHHHQVKQPAGLILVVWGMTCWVFPLLRTQPQR